MSKLPAEFVKAPAQPKQARSKRTRKASLISPDPVRDPRELLLHLTEEEHQALEEARQQLQQAGSEVTLEQMIHRVFAEWMMGGRAFAQPAPAPESAPPSAPCEVCAAREAAEARDAAARAAREASAASAANATAAACDAGAATHEPGSTRASTGTRSDDLVARLRAFLAAPLRTWRELAAGVWRTYVQRA